MKPSKDYYQNRRRLQKDLKYDRIEFKPTVTDIEEWVAILNQQFFSSRLPPFSKITITRQKNFHMLYHYWSKRSKRYKQSRLTVDQSFIDRKTFVEILAHEMVHARQFLRRHLVQKRDGKLYWKGVQSDNEEWEDEAYVLEERYYKEYVNERTE